MGVKRRCGKSFAFLLIPASKKKAGGSLRRPSFWLL